MKTGLVLEGGGMRGSYTTGVLDAFLEWGWMADYMIGVSAGASNGASYVSRQKGRGLCTNIKYIRDKRYLSWRNYIKTGSVFGMDFIFRDLAETLEPFDYAAFHDNICEFVAGVTNVLTGSPEYFGKEDITPGDYQVLRASASLPVLAKPVEINGQNYLDGGITDPIPAAKALADGCKKIVVVLTNQRGFTKKPQRFKRIYCAALKEYPAIIEAMEKRHVVYNRTLRFIYELEKEGIAYVIAPSMPLNISRLEKNPEKLFDAYRLGRRDGLNFLRKYRADL